MAEGENDLKAVSTEFRPISEGTALSTEFRPIGREDTEEKRSHFIQAAIFKDMVQASLMIGNMDFFNQSIQYLRGNIEFNNAEEEEKFYNEIFSDVFSKFIKSSLNSVESTFESVLTTFEILEQIISNAAGGLIGQSEEGSLIYAEKTPGNSRVVNEYYSKISTFVYQNNDASAFQKSFYFYTLYNRPFFNQFLDKHQLLFPDIKQQHLTNEIKLLSSQVRYTVSVLSDKDSLSTAVTSSFLGAVISTQWSAEEFYKNSANFAISLCQNSNSAELSIEFITALSNALEEQFGEKGTHRLEPEIYNQLARVKGKFCYEAYKHFVNPPKYSKAVEIDYLNYNAAHVHSYYESNAKLNKDDLKGKLAKISCARIKDHNLVKDFFTPDNFDELFETFSRYSNPECFAGLVFQMLSERNTDFIHKIGELLDVKEDNQFKAIVRNPSFWKEVNELLDAQYTIEKHTALCDFWTLRISEELQNQVLTHFKGQDHYGYMRMCELSRMEDSSRAKSNIEDIVRKYGDTKLLGMVSFMLNERIPFQHNDTYNFYSVIHNAINVKLPLIAAAKQEINNQIGVTFAIAAAKNNPDAIRQLLEGTEVFANFKSTYCGENCEQPSSTASLPYAVRKIINPEEMGNKLHELLDEECHNSFRVNMCDKITSFNDANTNPMTIGTLVGIFSVGFSFFQWGQIYKGAYTGIAYRHADNKLEAVRKLFFEGNPDLPHKLLKVWSAFIPLVYTAIIMPVSCSVEKLVCNKEDYLVLSISDAEETKDFIDIEITTSCTGNVTYAKELVNDFCTDNNYACNDITITNFDG